MLAAGFCDNNVRARAAVCGRGFLAGVGLCAGLLGGAGAFAGDFIRGDANRDGSVNVLDGVALLRSILGSEVPLPCADAADANDDGKLDLLDVLATLSFLFEDRDMAYPGALREGPDPTCDGLDCRDSALSTLPVAISEIHYNPEGGQFDDLHEFVELYNRTAVDFDLSGASFTQGIRFTFADGTILPAASYLLVLREPTNRIWRRAPGVKVGPYEGTLANGGERLTIVYPDCFGEETVRYDDRSPWPLAADGFGPSLERVDFRAPADDFHSWRASLRAVNIGSTGGSPAEENSTLGTPTHPTLVSHEAEPRHATSGDSVRVTVRLDVPPGDVRGVSVRWEQATDEVSEPQRQLMELVPGREGFAAFTATLPPAPSQTMVRYNLEVETADGSVVDLPHRAEVAPVLSYFVYDGEIESALPILWTIRSMRSGIVPGGHVPGGVRFTGAAIKEVAGQVPLVFDGAEHRTSRNGHKLKFLKGEEFRDFRTLNILEEIGQAVVTAGNGGPTTAHYEQFGYDMFRALGVPAPVVEWFRVIDYSERADSPERHTQRLLFEQINEGFAARNGLSPDGDIYKLVNQAQWEKQTNIESGRLNIDILTRDLSSDDAEIARAAVFSQLDLVNVGLYSAGSVLVHHGDNYSNNFFVYHDLSPEGRWMLFPWDLDTILQSPASVTAPLGGVISGPYHAQPELDAAYRDVLRQSIAPGGPFRREVIEPQLRAIEDLLLADLALQEAFLGFQRERRREVIRDATREILEHVDATIASLTAQLNE